MMNVQGTIRFLQDIPLYQNEKPYRLILPAEVNPTFTTNNLEFHEVEDIPIHDIRPCEDYFSLDIHGFQAEKHESKFSAIENNEDLNGYARETEEFFKAILGADEMREVKQSRRLAMNIRDRLCFHVPVQHAHTDETEVSGPDSLDLRLGKEIRSKYPESRYRLRMINTWRSLTERLENCPLAVLDCSSMSPSKDLLASDQIVPSRAAEIYHLLHRPNHKWHWLSRQCPNELLLFVQFDTDKENHARFCPHAAFINNDAPERAEKRRSIETRSVVITRLGD